MLCTMHRHDCGHFQTEHPTLRAVAPPSTSVQSVPLFVVYATSSHSNETQKLLPIPRERKTVGRVVRVRFGKAERGEGQ